LPFNFFKSIVIKPAFLFAKNFRLLAGEIYSAEQITSVKLNLMLTSRFDFVQQSNNFISHNIKELEFYLLAFGKRNHLNEKHLLLSLQRDSHFQG